MKRLNKRNTRKNTRQFPIHRNELKLDRASVNHLVEVAYVYRVRIEDTEIIITIKIRRRIN